MKAFKLRGAINLVNRRIYHKGEECYGITRGQKRRFSINISNVSSGEPDTFADTLLHELLHLYLFLLMGAWKFQLSDDAQHNIIDATVPFAANLLVREVKKLKQK